MSGTASPAAPGRVLLVDDNAINVELVVFVLRGAGWQVDAAADAAAALAQLERSRPDLILMDIQLPGVDGLQLTQRLKASPATSAIPVVAFTAYAMKGDDARVRAAGCDGYIAKPIDVATFAATVAACLAAGTAKSEFIHREERS